MKQLEEIGNQKNTVAVCVPIILSMRVQQRLIQIQHCV